MRLARSAQAPSHARGPWSEVVCGERDAVRKNCHKSWYLHLLGLPSLWTATWPAERTRANCGASGNHSSSHTLSREKTQGYDSQWSAFSFVWRKRSWTRRINAGSTHWLITKKTATYVGVCRIFHIASWTIEVNLSLNSHKNHDQGKVIVCCCVCQKTLNKSRKDASLFCKTFSFFVQPTVSQPIFSAYLYKGEQIWSNQGGRTKPQSRTKCVGTLGTQVHSTFLRRDMDGICFFLQSH